MTGKQCSMMNVNSVDLFLPTVYRFHLIHACTSLIQATIQVKRRCAGRSRHGISLLQNMSYDCLRWQNRRSECAVIQWLVSGSLRSRIRNAGSRVYECRVSHRTCQGMAYRCCCLNDGGVPSTICEECHGIRGTHCIIE